VLSYVVPGVEAGLSWSIGGPFHRLSPQAKLLAIVGLLDFLWLIFGTLFYYLMPNYLIGDLTFSKSFYFAANVGLGIGFCNVSVHHSQAKIFTGCFVILGTSLVVGTLVAAVNHLLSHNVHHTEPVLTLGEGRFQMIWTMRELYLLAAWVLWLCVGMLWYAYSQEQDLATSFYFATTVFSTAGMESVQTKELDLLLCTLYILVAVPLNIVAWGDMMSNYFERYQHEKELEQLESHATQPADAATALIEREKRMEWGDFLEEKLVSSKLITSDTIDIVKEEFSKRKNP